MNGAVHLILYVADQAASTEFYARSLDVAPSLNVPGMTEFRIGSSTILGLMPVSSIRRLLGEALPDPAMASGVPRAELYLHVNDVELFHRRALAAGAKELSPPAMRNWGHFVSYALDPDAHVIAFATETVQERAVGPASNGV